MRSNLDILSRSWDALKSKWLLGHWDPFVARHPEFGVGSVGFGLGTLALGGALSFGMSRTMVLIYRGHTPQFETYFDGFKHFLPTLVAFLLVSVIVLVGFVLLVIPGIIAAIGCPKRFTSSKTNLNWEQRAPSERKLASDLDQRQHVEGLFHELPDLRS